LLASYTKYTRHVPAEVKSLLMIQQVVKRKGCFIVIAFQLYFRVCH